MLYQTFPSDPPFPLQIPMKPCRDCSTLVSAAERSCPHCGILNPVITWVAFPDGSHHTQRAAAADRARTMASPAHRAPPLPAAAAAAMHLPPTVHRTGFARYFGPVESVDEARSVILDASNAFYFLAALNLLLGLFIMPGGIVDAVLLAGLSLWLRSTSSRLAASILLLSLVGVASTLMAIAGTAPGGRNLYLALLAVGISYRSVRATMILANTGGPRLAL